VSTTLEIACPLLVCGGFVYGFIRYFIAPQPEQPVDDRAAWIDDLIAAETHPGRRAALRMLRHTNDLEEL